MSNRGGKRTQAGRKPGSPNKATAAIRALAGEHADKAIDILAELMEGQDTPAAARITAAKELLERGFGRPGSYAALELDTPLSELQPREAISAITDAVTGGAISVEEGQRLVAMIEARIKAVELAELESRLTELEGAK
ncbi:MAG: hypothetical protein GY761_18110 [Hyphomicrobiales bacterium]|nr:hypothetical protein [Hyphomicrobiales bacterium]